MPAPLLKPNDVIRTPLGMLVRIEELRADGKRDGRYIETGEPVVIDPDLPGIELVHSAVPRRWKSHALT